MGFKNALTIRRISFIALFLAFNHFSFAESDDLKEEFAFENGPRFDMPEEQQKLIDQTIAELKSGHGITTVPKPDNALASSAFLSRYLREFSSVEQDGGPKNYDRLFQRINRCASQYPIMLDDPRLDWDIRRSLLVYESSSDGEDYYEEGPMYEGDSPSGHTMDNIKDLAWMYMERHADRLMKDKNRQKWWVAHLIRGLIKPVGSRADRWFLFQLCVFANPDMNLKDVPLPAPEDSNEKPLRKPMTEDPFLVVDEDTKPPSFLEALHRIADPLKLSIEVWGIDPQKLPPARILPKSLEMVKWPSDKSFIIGQESWSDPEKEPHYALERGSPEWGVYGFRYVGQRAHYIHIRIPEDRKDGVFFFPFNKRLNVWPKADMDDGLLQMLKVEGIIDDSMWKLLVEARGFHGLKTTYKTN
jgi:hypothetical protein